MASDGHPAGLWRTHCLLFACLHSLLPHPILIQTCVDGDLLPQSEDEDEDGDDLPQSGDEDEDGDLLSQSGDADGEGIPSSQGNEQAVPYDLQTPIKRNLENNLGIRSPKSIPVDVAFSVVVNEEDAWFASLYSPANALHFACKHGLFMKVFEPADVLMNVGISLLPVFRTLVFDPGELQSSHESDHVGCHLAAMTSTTRSTFATDHAHSKDSVSSAKFSANSALLPQQLADALSMEPLLATMNVTLESYIFTGAVIHSPSDFILAIAEDVLDSIHCDTDDGSHLTTRNVLLNMLWADCVVVAASVLYACETCKFAEVDDNQPDFLDDKSHFTGFSHGTTHGKFYKDNASPYGCSLWLNGSNFREATAAHFLIPLRGRRCEQWNDEVIGVTGTMMMKLLELFHLTKDLLDPG